MQEDPEKLAQEIADDLVLDLPVLDEPGIYTTDRQVKVDARGIPGRIVFPGRGPVLIDATKITFHIPFKGDPEIFDVSPSTHSLNPPVADIDPQRREILITCEAVDENSPVKVNFERTLQAIKQHLDWLRPVCQPNGCN